MAPISVSILLHKWGLRPQAPALIHTRELGSAETVAIGKPSHVPRWRHGGMEVAESDEGASTNFSQEDGRARRRCATLSLRSLVGLCATSALACTQGSCLGSGGMIFAPCRSHGKCLPVNMQLVFRGYGTNITFYHEEQPDASSFHVR